MPHFDGMEDDVLSRFYNIQFSCVCFTAQSITLISVGLLGSYGHTCKLVQKRGKRGERERRGGGQEKKKRKRTTTVKQVQPEHNALARMMKISLDHSAF